MSSGYIHCAHKHCFAVIIGNPGDLCEDCKEFDAGPHGSVSCEICDGCDNDSVEES